MSAAAALQDPTAQPWGGQPRRGHLRLVPAAPDTEAAPSLRLTRRGRLTRTLGVLLALVVAAGAVLLTVLPADAGSEIVVQPGQTLSEIAVTHLPDLTPDRAMVQIQRANGMNTGHVQAGQTLVIPSR
ncbi:LysM peptidoglycan-binding domain-containing protein [Ornithinimicrobium sediminis]|uniref:LysM peptidoglycan-binding domain-containing protein n=1 Tax=Ornithinimicrobium sediminis TaxID=2904603 RepID=UPI001E3ED605|nr:LysM peptidoglycan-binding domain-containing protein [Ornithinimicrobium sediminis]MCE0485290.1 LysM peptidoglycan-binding domain-containing protein [Ornithinimicrobium sediminis]